MNASALRKTLSITVVLLLALIGGAASVAAQTDPVEGCEYFEETGHNLCSPILEFWEANDGINQFGMPLTEAYDELSGDTLMEYTVQYFENVRIEYRPDNAGTPYEFVLGRLGAEVLFYSDGGVPWQDLPKADPSAEHYDAITGQAVAPEFWDYYSTHGLNFGDDGVTYRESLALFGFPISGLEEAMNAEGVLVPVQWFERARLELEPSGDVAMSPLGVAMTERDGQFSLRIQRELDASLQYWQETLTVPGMMAGLWVPGEGEWSNVVGVSDIETGEPMHFDQHVRIGSITKTMTTTLIMQLADEGLLSMDDTVDMYFDDVPNGDTITIFDLSSLTSGIASYTVDPDFQEVLFTDPEYEWDPMELVDIGIRNTAAGCPNDPDACFPAGESWYYSNTNVVMLGLIIEQVTGRSYGEVFAEGILEPLNLEHTIHPVNADMPEPLAHGYTLQGVPDGSDERQDATFWNPSWSFAVGDAISTFDDLHTWARALGSGALISPEMQELRQTKVTVGPNTEERAYAVGMGYSHGWWGHGGELPGYNSVAYYRPDIDAVFVVITNADLVPFEDTLVHPAYLMGDSIIDIAAREAPLGEFDHEVPFVDESLTNDEG